MKTKMTKINHYYQPTGHSCGPTCIAMVLEFLELRQGKKRKEGGDDGLIEYICNACGTDWAVGTPPDRMEKGMKHFSMKYTEYSHLKDPYKLLQTILSEGNIGILRTITKGVPHWIIVDEYLLEENLFHVLDPWQGIIKYSIKDLDGIWKQRDYQFFEIIVPQNTAFSYAEGHPMHQQ